MKETLLTLCWYFSVSSVIYGQGGFQQKYDTFRFSLYNQLEQEQPLSTSQNMAESVKTFLKEHEKEVLRFRKAQLEQYQGTSMEQPHVYRALNDSLIEEQRDQMLLIYPQKILSQISQGPNSRDVPENIQIILEFLSVDPIYLVRSMSAQATSQILVKYQQMAIKELSAVYGKMAMGGTHISTKKLDKRRWTLQLNNYYFIYDYSVNIDSGEIKLLTIKTRIS